MLDAPNAIDLLGAGMRGAQLGLNEGQTDVYTKITSRDFDKMLVLGEAGAGKTFVLTHALAELHRQGAKVLLCAPTHLARIALLAKMPEDVRHEVETRTVASLLSRFGFNAGDGSVAFSKPQSTRINSYDVIAIDECSMLGKGEYDVISTSAAKIIFTGDFKQLPAIMQKGSGMMDDPLVEKFALTEQMRAPGVIHKLAELNREGIHFPTESVSDENSEVVVHRTTSDMLQRMISDLVGDVRGMAAHPNYRFITHKNSTMYEVGAMIRDSVIAQLGGQGAADAPITPGEHLLNYETSPAAYNGEVVEVVDVTRDGGASHSHLWESYKVEVRGSRGTCWVNIIDPRKLETASKYLEERQELLKEANKRKAFDAAKSYFDEIQHFSNYWTKMFYPFAMTTHKAQGQTIERTYVDTQSYAKASNKRALLYVGLSRASKALHTVKVEAPRWQIVREINTSYKATKAIYEEVFNEPAHKVRIRTGLPAQTPEQKMILTEYMQALIDDAQQDKEPSFEIEAFGTPTLSEVAF